MKPVVLSWLLVALLGVWPHRLRAAEAGEETPGEAAEEVKPTGEKQRTLAERVPAVTGRMFKKSGRLEFTPAIGMSLNDPFYDHIMVSGTLAFHVLESLWIGASGDFYTSLANDPPVVGGSPAVPAYDHPLFGGRLELGWAPFYGKLSVLAEGVLHFDTYLSLGGGIVSPKNADKAIAGTVALGQHFFFNDWMGIRLELRDQMFKYARDPASNKALQHLLSASLGLCFYIPSSFEREKP